MAEVMVSDLGADVDAIGDTPGYSPLWIACLNGHLDTALFLIKHGADARVKDTKDGRTILHFLNRFRTRDSISHILQIGLQAGLALDEPDVEGNTPLLSTFIGCDFSHGVAAQMLLRARANPLIHSKMKFSAAVGALRNLDVELLASIFEQAGKHEFYDDEGMRMSISPLEQVKARVFNFLLHQSEFYCRRVCGSDTDMKLKAVIDLVLQENMSSTFRSMGLMEGDSTPLIISSYRRRNDLLKVILSSAACSDLDAVDSYGMTAIHWCAERGNLEGAKELLRAGANPLLFENKGFNVFHIASRFAPDFLVRILDAIESGEVPHPQGLHSRALLAISTRNEDKAPPYFLLVVEGTPEHLRVAEILRKQYSLDYDACDIPSLRLFHHGEYEAKMTLMAYLTAGSVVTNIITLSQVEYLLNLEPKPRFRADTSGKTLLHFAVSGFYHGKCVPYASHLHILQLIYKG
jgi:ankyrin repeat protein